ncbi:MAG: protein kinase [Lachnospiraceae bacterium]|nr:protein kinase [Lachnospiraceae bacterium]
MGTGSTSEKNNSLVLPIGFGLAGGRYSILRVLGHGGFGVTYLSRDNFLGRYVAIKELFPSGSVVRDPVTFRISVSPDREEFFAHISKRFREEAQTLAALNSHPEILQVYDIFDELGTVYYSMEYLDGEDFGSITKKTGPVSWEKAEKPVKDIANALRILHGKGLVHRDISPDNIFVLKNGSAKLIDFGSVRRQSADHFTTIFKDSFAPVELFLFDGKQGPWTDSYSLCATLYYLMSGKVPAKAPDRAAKIGLGEKDPLVPLSDLNIKAPSYVTEAVMKGLASGIGERFMNMDDFLAAFFPGEMMSSGITERLTDNHSAMQNVPVQAPPVQGKGRESGKMLFCVRGQFSGRTFPLVKGQTLSMGRGPGNDISYPDGPGLSKGISRRHCSFYTDPSGCVLLRDDKSTYGTFLGGVRMASGIWTGVDEGQVIRLGDEEYRIIR